MRRERASLVTLRPPLGVSDQSPRLILSFDRDWYASYCLTSTIDPLRLLRETATLLLLFNFYRSNLSLTATLLLLFNLHPSIWMRRGGEGRGAQDGEGQAGQRDVHGSSV